MIAFDAKKKKELEGLRSRKLHQIITEHDQPKPDYVRGKEENPAEE